MADGAGGVGKAVTDTLKDIGKDLTVNLASDMFNTIAGTKPANQAQQGQSSQQMQQVQKNAQIANITRRIQQMQQRRAQATKQTQQQEEQRQQMLQQEQRHQEEIKKENGGVGGKMKDMFANWGNTLARRGKGEQRGNKMHG